MDTLQSLAFEALTVPNPASGYSVFLAGCVEGNYEEVRNILSFSPSLVDTWIALKTPALERAGPEYAGKTPADIVMALNTPSHQSIQETFQPYLTNMETVSLIHLAARMGTVRHIRRLVSTGANINCVSHHKEHEYSTPVCLAAAYNMTEVVEELVSQGAELRKKGLISLNAAHFAAKRGNTKNLLYLLDKEPQLTTREVDEGLSLLQSAAREGHVETLETLINIGLDVNEPFQCTYVDDHDPLGLPNAGDHDSDLKPYEFDVFTEEATPLMVAAKCGHINTVQFLISQGAEVTARDEEGCSALFYACNGEHFDMVQFLIKSQLVARSMDNCGRSLLHVVTDMKTADLLISEHGLNVNACDSDNETPLHYAVKHKDIKMAGYFIQHGANVNAEASHQRPPLLTALQNPCKLEMVSLLLKSGCSLSSFLYGLRFHTEEYCIDPNVVRLLIESSYNVNLRGDGEFYGTLLHLAAGMDLESSRILIECGADVNLEDCFGYLPIHSAALHGQTDIVQLLLKRGSKIGDEDRPNGCIALMKKAADSGNLETFKMVLELSEDLEEICGVGYNILHIVAKWRLTKLVQAVLEHVIYLSSKSGKVEPTLKCAIHHVNNWNGLSILHAAAIRGHIEIVEILLMYAMDLNGRNKYLRHQSTAGSSLDMQGNTSLHDAMEMGLAEELMVTITELYLKKGWDIDTTNESGCSVLHIAAAQHWQNRTVLQLLIEKGSNIAAVDNKGNTALHFAACSGETGNAQILLKHELVMRKGNEKDGKYLRSSCLHVRNVDGQTPLHLAARRWEKLSMMPLKFKSGIKAADQKYGSTWTCTPLFNCCHLATEDFGGKKPTANRSVDVLQVLVEHGADVSAVDNDGNTALHIAARQQLHDQYMFLIESGADVNLTNNKGDQASTVLYAKRSEQEASETGGKNEREGSSSI